MSETAEAGHSTTAFTAILFRDRDGVYCVSVPALNCFSHGSTEQEAMENIREAVALTLEDMQADGEPVPADLDSPKLTSVTV